MPPPPPPPPAPPFGHRFRVNYAFTLFHVALRRPLWCMSRVDHLVARGGKGGKGDLRLETTSELTCCSTSPLFGPPYLIIPSYHLPFTSVSVIAPCARRPCAYYRWNVDGDVWVTADRPFRGNFIRIMDTFTTRWNQKSQSSNRESILVVAADYKILILREIIYNKYVASKKKYDI